MGSHRSGSRGHPLALHAALVVGTVSAVGFTLPLLALGVTAGGWTGAKLLCAAAHLVLLVWWLAILGRAWQHSVQALRHGLVVQAAFLWPYVTTAVLGAMVWDPALAALFFSPQRLLLGFLALVLLVLCFPGRSTSRVGQRPLPSTD